MSTGHPPTRLAPYLRRIVNAEAGGEGTDEKLELFTRIHTGLFRRRAAGSDDDGGYSFECTIEEPFHCTVHIKRDRKSNNQPGGESENVFRLCFALQGNSREFWWTLSGLDSDADKARRRPQSSNKQAIIKHLQSKLLEKYQTQASLSLHPMEIYHEYCSVMLDWSVALMGESLQRMQHALCPQQESGQRPSRPHSRAFTVRNNRVPAPINEAFFGNEHPLPPTMRITMQDGNPHIHQILIDNPFGGAGEEQSTAIALWHAVTNKVTESENVYAYTNVDGLCKHLVRIVYRSMHTWLTALIAPLLGAGSNTVFFSLSPEFHTIHLTPKDSVGLHGAAAPKAIVDTTTLIHPHRIATGRDDNNLHSTDAEPSLQKHLAACTRAAAIALISKRIAKVLQVPPSMRHDLVAIGSFDGCGEKEKISIASFPYSSILIDVSVVGGGNGSPLFECTLIARHPPASTASIISSTQNGHKNVPEKSRKITLDQADEAPQKENDELAVFLVEFCSDAFDAHLRCHGYHYHHASDALTRLINYPAIYPVHSVHVEKEPASTDDALCGAFILFRIVFEIATDSLEAKSGNVNTAGVIWDSALTIEHLQDHFVTSKQTKQQKEPCPSSPPSSLPKCTMTHNGMWQIGPFSDVWRALDEFRFVCMRTCAHAQAKLPTCQ